MYYFPFMELNVAYFSKVKIIRRKYLLKIKIIIIRINPKHKKDVNIWKFLFYFFFYISKEKNYYRYKTESLKSDKK